MNAGSRALPSARVATPASRNSLTSRSCKVLFARSTRPPVHARGRLLAGLELAQMMSMLSACKARTNWVMPPAFAGAGSAAQRARVVDPENPMLVAVKRHRLAPDLQIGTSRVKIGESRLALDKLQMHQPADRVVDEHQQGALRPAVLEPPMLAAVDLHQFAIALAPRPRLMNSSLPLLAIEPQPVGNHPLPQGLAGEPKAVLGGELLGGQGRPEIGIIVAHDP